jgi:hypothetical protein
MTRVAAAGKLAEMPDHDPIRLELELAAWPDPIAGRVCDGHGRTRAFHGWLGLAAALAALAGTRPGDDTDPV